MTTDHKQNESISYCVEELENELEEEINIENLMSEIYDSELNDSELNDSLIVSKMINYQENFTVKEVSKILWNLYGITRE